MSLLRILDAGEKGADGPVNVLILRGNRVQLFSPLAFLPSSAREEPKHSMPFVEDSSPPPGR